MTCVRLGPGLGNGFLCIEPDYRIKDRAGKVWYFEYHKFCGPTVLRRDGELSKRQPTEKSPFWDVLDGWIQQGQRVETLDGITWAKWDR